MKRILLLKHLRDHGCLLIREGRRHSVFLNPKEERTSTVPRHTDVDTFLVVKICKDLGIPPIRKK